MDEEIREEIREARFSVGIFAMLGRWSEELQLRVAVALDEWMKYL